MNDATANAMSAAPTTMLIRAMPRSASTTMSVPMLPAKPPPGSMSGLWTWKGRAPATSTQGTARRHRASPAARTPCASLRGRLYMPDHTVQFDGKHKPDAYDEDASSGNVRLLRWPATIPPAPASTTALLGSPFMRGFGPRQATGNAPADSEPSPKQDSVIVAPVSLENNRASVSNMEAASEKFGQMNIRLPAKHLTPQRNADKIEAAATSGK